MFKVTKTNLHPFINIVIILCRRVCISEYLKKCECFYFESVLYVYCIV